MLMSTQVFAISYPSAQHQVIVTVKKKRNPNDITSGTQQNSHTGNLAFSFAQRNVEMSWPSLTLKKQNVIKHT